MEGFEELTQRINEVGDHIPAQDKIQAGLRAVFQYASTNRDLFPDHARTPGSQELNLFAFNYYAGVVEDILNRWASGARPALPVELLAQFIDGGRSPAGAVVVEDDHGLSPEEISDITYQLLFHGIPPAQRRDAPVHSP
jgi:hypothetical protein